MSDMESDQDSSPNRSRQLEDEERALRERLLAKQATLKTLTSDKSATKHKPIVWDEDEDHEGPGVFAPAQQRAREPSPPRVRRRSSSPVKETKADAVRKEGVREGWQQWRAEAEKTVKSRTGFVRNTVVRYNKELTFSSSSRQVSMRTPSPALKERPSSRHERKTDRHERKRREDDRRRPTSRDARDSRYKSRRGLFSCTSYVFKFNKRTEDDSPHRERYRKHPRIEAPADGRPLRHTERHRAHKDDKGDKDKTTSGNVEEKSHVISAVDLWKRNSASVLSL